LVGIDKVKQRLEGNAGDLVVSFPYKEGEIEKISYTLENSFLNIIVKAGEKGLSFNQNDIQFKRSTGSSKVIFTIGFSRISDLEDTISVEGLSSVTVINVDNKDDNERFGDIVLVSGNLSISEGIASLISNLNLKIDVDASQNLLSGIIEATNNFQNSRTSPLALEMSAYLMKNGAARAQKSITIKEENILEEQPVIRSSSDNKNKTDVNNPPEDWLTPKIYKGSTSI
jgi:nanoRNase/pAp phosphatase (c-di-AMP/oligoRNAs hydrolase)